MLDWSFQFDWWISHRKRPCCGNALTKALACFSYARIKAVLDDEDRWPRYWRDLAEALHIDSAQLYRKRVGEYGSHVFEFLTLCHIVGLEPNQLFPRIEDWLEKSVRHLCVNSSNAALAEENRRAFAKYCLLFWPDERNQGFHLEEARVARVAKAMKHQFHSADAVAGAIGAVADAVDDKLSQGMT